MRSFHFGDPAEPLVGAYHAPQDRAPHGAVLLCASIGHEYMRGHWVLRRLAERLAAAGFAAMRFDYFGVGDSAGCDGAGGPSRWRGDCQLAMQELRDMAGLDDVALVGLRVGAALAYDVAAGGTALSHLILWDPVVKGATFLEDVAAMQAQHLGLLTVHQAALSGETEWLGSLYPAALQDELGGINLLTGPVPAAVPRRHVLTSCGDPRQGAEHDQLAARAAMTLHHVSESSEWASVHHFGHAVLGSEALHRIVSILKGED